MGKNNSIKKAAQILKEAKIVSNPSKVHTEFDEVKIISVDGEHVRQKNIKFTMGGHHYVYKDIPENEIWLDKIMKKPDYVSTAVHELTERLLMKYLNYTYDDAHEICNVVETALRKSLSGKKPKVQ